MKDSARVRFGQHVARMRRQLWLSQERLADMAGINTVTLRHIEDGELNITLDVLNRIAVVLGGELEIVIKDIEL